MDLFGKGTLGLVLVLFGNQVKDPHGLVARMGSLSRASSWKKNGWIPLSVF
jgi:hypothetical protein